MLRHAGLDFWLAQTIAIANETIKCCYRFRWLSHTENEVTCAKAELDIEPRLLDRNSTAHDQRNNPSAKKLHRIHSCGIWVQVNHRVWQVAWFICLLP